MKYIEVKHRDGVARYSVWLAIDYPLVNVSATAVIVHHSDPGCYPILHHIEVSREDCRKGIGLAMLEHLMHRYGKLAAIWCTPEGEMLARAFERKHGEQPWRIGAYSEDEMRDVFAKAYRGAISHRLTASHAEVRA